MDPRRLKARYVAAGQRLTVQRLAVARALAGDRSHPSARQVLERVQSRFPTVAPATVYRILEEFVAMGELRVVDLPGGARRYDPNLDPHSHLVCRRCGAVEDVDLDLVRVQADADYAARRAVQSVEVTLSGLCTSCAAGEGGQGRGLSRAAHPPSGGRSGTRPPSPRGPAGRSR